MNILKEKQTLVLDDIKCDVCGVSCKIEDITDSFEFALLSAQWGYFSKRDGEDHECHFCQDCYEKVKNFIEELGGQINITNLFIGDL